LSRLRKEFPALMAILAILSLLESSFLS